MISSLCDATVDMFGNNVHVRPSAEDGSTQWTQPERSRIDPGWKCWPRAELDRLVKVIPAFLVSSFHWITLCTIFSFVSFLQSDNTTAFCFDKCRFKLTTDKTGTARSVVFRELKVPLAYTCEASFCGIDPYHFNTEGKINYFPKNILGVHLIKGYVGADFQRAGVSFLQAMYVLLLNKKVCEGQATRALSAISAQRLSVLDTIERHLSVPTMMYHSNIIFNEAFQSVDMNGDGWNQPKYVATPFSPGKVPFRDTLSPSSKSRYEKEDQRARHRADSRSSKRWARLFGLSKGDDCSWKDETDVEIFSDILPQSMTIYGAIQWHESDTDIPLLDGKASLCFRNRSSPPIDFATVDHNLGEACKEVLSIPSIEKTEQEDIDEEGQSDASDDCPSDDNLDIAALVKLLRQSGLKDAAAQILGRKKVSEQSDNESEGEQDGKKKRNRVVKDKSKQYKVKGLSDASALMAPMHRMKALAMLNERRNNNSQDAESKDGGTVSNGGEPNRRKPPVFKHSSNKKKKKTLKEREGTPSSSREDSIGEKPASADESSDGRDSESTIRTVNHTQIGKLPLIPRNAELTILPAERPQSEDPNTLCRKETKTSARSSSRTQSSSARTSDDSPSLALPPCPGDYEPSPTFSPWEIEHEQNMTARLQDNGNTDTLSSRGESAGHKPPKALSKRRRPFSGQARTTNQKGVLLRSQSCQPRQMRRSKTSSKY